MIEADRVLSTPRITASKIDLPDQARRRLLTIAAGGAVAATIPIATLAGIPTAADPVFALIAAKQAADVAHGDAITVQDKADVRYGYDSPQAWDADEACEEACHRAMDAAWQLARSAPTTFAGVVAILRFTNQFEDEGMEWPDTDRVGGEGWHYQLRATMAQALETIIRQGGAA